jgi:hypothetical protein
MDATQKAILQNEEKAEAIRARGDSIRSEKVREANEQFSSLLLAEGVEDIKAMSEALAFAGALAQLTVKERAVIESGTNHEWTAEQETKFKSWILTAIPGNVFERYKTQELAFEGSREPAALTRIAKYLAGNTSHFLSISLVSGVDLVKGRPEDIKKRVSEKAPVIAEWIREQWASRNAVNSTAITSAEKKATALRKFSKAAGTVAKKGVSPEEAEKAVADAFRAYHEAQAEKDAKDAEKREKIRGDSLTPEQVASDFAALLAAGEGDEEQTA